MRQEGGAILVLEKDFTSQSVINFFYKSGGNDINLGGLDVRGVPRISVKVLSPTMLSFTLPRDAPPGEAYVQVLNPPFTAAFNSGTGPDGSLMLKSA
ncbi:MAG: hypothetical protein ACM3NO_10165 [Deltaproteobacteria bacterium]